VSRRSLTARTRITLLLVVLFALGGTIIVSITYALVASNLTRSAIKNPALNPSLLSACANFGNASGPIDPNLKEKCQATFKLGAAAAANAQRNGVLSSLLLESILTVVGATTVAAVVGWFVAGRILRPIIQLTAAARSATETNLSQRLDLQGPRDELRELAETFDDMLERLELAFLSQQRFIANASHELRTPLTVIRTTVDVVLAKPRASRAELIEMGNAVRRAVLRADALTTTLLTLARNERGLTASEPLELDALAQEVIESTAVGELTVTAQIQPALILGDERLIERLIANLMDNATRYNVPRGEVTVSTGTRSGVAFLRVENTGPVVSDEQVERIFEPFTRIDERVAVEGFGLGLALVRSIAQSHNGSVTAKTRPHGGLDVWVEFAALTRPTDLEDDNIALDSVHARPR
jgi:signal transduction histidine kinase